MIDCITLFTKQKINSQQSKMAQTMMSKNASAEQLIEEYKTLIEIEKEKIVKLTNENYWIL